MLLKNSSTSQVSRYNYFVTYSTTIAIFFKSSCHCPLKLITTFTEITVPFCSTTQFYAEVPISTTSNMNQITNPTTATIKAASKTPSKVCTNIDVILSDCQSKTITSEENKVTIKNQILNVDHQLHTFDTEFKFVKSNIVGIEGQLQIKGEKT